MSTFELCETVRPLLSAVVDGEATPTETALAEEHVRGCRACASHLAFLRLSHGVLARTPDSFPPAALAERIAAATYGKPSLATRFLGFLQPAPARYALATALTVGIVAVVVSRLPQPVTAPPRVAEAPHAGPVPRAGTGSGNPVQGTSASRPEDRAPVIAARPAVSPPSAPRSASGGPAKTDRVASSAAQTPAFGSANAESGRTGERPAARVAGVAKSAAADGAATAARSPQAPAPSKPQPRPVPSHVVTAYQPKVSAPNPLNGGDGSASPGGVTVDSGGAPAPRTSPTPAVRDAGSSAAIAAASNPAVNSTPTARAPVAEEKAPVVIASLPDEDEGTALALKNVGPRSLSGEVAMNSRGGGRRNSGLNSSFGVADGRGGNMPIVDAPVK